MKHWIKTQSDGYAWSWCGLSFISGHRALVHTPSATTCQECLRHA